MMNSRAATRAAMATLLALATLLGAGVVFFPDMRTWFASNAWWGWGAFLVMVLFNAGRLEIVDRTREQLRTANQKIDSLEERALLGSARDRVQFQSVVDDLPWDHEPLFWLQNSPLKQWTDEQSGPLYDLESKWAEWFFDSVEVQSVFEDLRQALGALTTWMASNAFSPTPAELRGMAWQRGDALLYRIPDGDDLPGGWPAHVALRREGAQLASDFLEMRRRFERTGRAAGL